MKTLSRPAPSSMKCQYKEASAEQDGGGGVGEGWSEAGTPAVSSTSRLPCSWPMALHPKMGPEDQGRFKSDVILLSLVSPF